MKKFLKRVYRKFFPLTPSVPVAAQKKLSENTVFVFNGFRGEYDEMGHDLYRDSVPFRECIDHCHEVIKDRVDLKSLFTNKDKSVTACTDLEKGLVITAIQCALTDLFISKGISPKAVIGLCLGEVAAGYASGAYSLESAMHLSAAVMDAVAHMDDKGQYLFTQLSAEQAVVMTESAYGKLSLIYNGSPERSIFFVLEKDKDTIYSLLDSRQVPYTVINYPKSYHTPYSQNKQSLSGGPGFIPEQQPLHTHFYSAFQGRKMPAGSLIADTHYSDMVSKPVLYGSAILAALQDGYDTFIDMSAKDLRSSDIEDCGKYLHKDIVVYPTLIEGASASDNINATIENLKKLHGYTGRQSRETRSDFIHEENPDFIRNPFPYYKSLKASNNIFFVRERNHYMVLDYESINDILKNPTLFSSKFYQVSDTVLLGAEPFNHARARKLLGQNFEGDLIQKMSASIEAIATKQLSVADSRSFNIVQEYALPITEAVVSEIIGFTAEELEAVRELIGPDKYDLSYIPEIEHLIEHFVSKNIPRKEGSLLQKYREHDADYFNNDEIVSITKLLWLAGTTTTSMLISSAVYTLLTDSRILDTLKGDWPLLPSFIEEVLRTAPPELIIWRTNTEAVELNGVSIPKDSELRLCLAAANRDPAVFEQPDKIILDRTNKRHMTFAAGPHYCIGAGLARLEAKIAIEVLFKNMEHVQLADRTSTVSYLKSDHFRALTELYVTSGRNDSFIP